MYPSVSIVVPIILTVLYYTPTPMRLVGGPATVIDGDTLVVADEQVRLKRGEVPVRVSVSGTGAERRARCPRGNVRG